MICIEVQFPCGDFSCEDNHGKQLDFPFPTHVVSAFMSTGGAERDEKLRYALRSLESVPPRILYSGSVGRKRVPVKLGHAMLSDTVSTAKSSGIDVTSWLAGTTQRGVKSFVGKDDAVVFDKSIFYVFDIEGTTTIGASTVDIVDVLQHYSGQIGFIGAADSPAVVRVYSVDSVHGLDASVTLTPWEIPPRDKRLATFVDCPDVDYVDSMVSRYRSKRNNAYSTAGVCAVAYTASAKVGNVETVTLGFTPVDKWASVCADIADTYGVQIIPHVIRDTLLWAITIVNPADGDNSGTPDSGNNPNSSVDSSDTLSTTTLSSIMDYFDDVYMVDNVRLLEPYCTTGFEWVYEGFVGNVNNVLARASIMADVRDCTGAGFEDFEVVLSPAHYSPHRISGRGCWDVKVVFDRERVPDGVSGPIVLAGWQAIRCVDNPGVDNS